MCATVMYGAHDVRVEERPDPTIRDPKDALVRVVAAGVCGSDLHPYASMEATSQGRPMGHELIGVIEDVGADVSTLRRGDLVVSPFTYSDGTCEFCRDGLQSSCPNGDRFGFDHVDGGQGGEAVRLPWADGTLVKLPADPDDDLLPHLLTLADVFCTGHHAAVSANVVPRTLVTVIGDGAVGLCAVLAARRLGAEQIILMGRNPDRTSLGKQFGATDVVAARGDEGIEKVHELTGGNGTHAVLECVGSPATLETSFGVVRDGGTVSRVGIPSYDQGPIGMSMISRNITLTGGTDPARSYIEELLPEVLDGTLRPGRVFDRTGRLDDVPDGYRAMADREILKLFVRP